MHEGETIPQKFFFVPLYLQFDVSTKLQHVKAFTEIAEQYNVRSLFQKGVTIHIEENSMANEDEYFNLIMSTLGI